MTVQFRSRWPLALALVAALAPAPAAAQDPAPAETDAAGSRTHLVRAGDTLWDLARTYLNDPFLWPEIYRLNTEVVEDPHWIYPGETLRLPGDAGIAPVQEVAGATTPLDEGAPPSRSRTVFAGLRGSSRAGRSDVLGRAARPLIRRGDYLAAPWLTRVGGVDGAGRVGARLDVSDIAAVRAVERLQLNDVVAMSTPEGKVAMAGDRYLTYRLDREIVDRGQVAIPTGVILVEAAEGGQPKVSRIVEAFDQVRVGDHVIPLDSFVAQPFAAPTPVEILGVPGRVLWIESDPVLASLHQYVILSCVENEVRPGDQFVLLRAANASTSSESPDVLAVVQIVRAGPTGSTGMIIGQAQGGVQVGTPARQSARMQQ